MTTIGQILRNLFFSETVEPKVTTIETALQQPHERDIYEGSEFLNDLIRTEDAEDDPLFV
ncbi:MAG: hypothetical protein ACTHLD_20355 [Chitinophaga sp.]|jgi:hypothetical protein